MSDNGGGSKNADRSRKLLQRYWSGAHGLSDDLATELVSVLAERDRLAEAVTRAVAWADRHGKEPDWLDEARAALAGEGRGYDLLQKRDAAVAEGITAMINKIKSRGEGWP